MVEKICQRDGILCKFYKNPQENESYILEADIDQERYEELMEDVKCEIQRGDSPIPVYGPKTMANPQKFKRLRKLNGTGCFQLLKKAEDDIFL